MKRQFLTNIMLGLALGWSGCTMMPEYERPDAPVSETWPGDEASTTATNVAAADMDWQDFFADERLRELIALALENNRDMRVAALRVEQARAQYRIQRAALYPGVEGEARYERQRFSGAVTAFSGGSILTTYSLDVGAAYELDLFGRVRSLKKEALEGYFATEEARKSTQIALISEVAARYLELLQYREAKVIGQQTLEAVQASYELNLRGFEAGIVSELELQTAASQVQSARVEIAEYTQLVAQAENALTFVVGQPIPSNLPAGQPFEEQDFISHVPAGMPAEILQRRPDILAAEHQLMSANANIGAARAAFFPRILLTGSAGTASAELSDLFTGPSETWRFSPQITVPIFEMGATRARLNVAKINKRIEIANYEKAIQRAFREVVDALAVRAVLNEKLDAQEQLLEAQKKRFDITQARYDQGVDSYVDVLLAQQALYDARQRLLQFQSARLLNAVALYRSLGGGWKS